MSSKRHLDIIPSSVAYSRTKGIDESISFLLVECLASVIALSMDEKILPWNSAVITETGDKTNLGLLWDD